MRAFILLGLLLAGCGVREQGTGNSPAPEPEVQPVNSGAAASAPAARGIAPTKDGVHPCLTQDGKPVTRKLKALGTEPFWAAEIEGRCVTYRTPEEDKTRIWTRIAQSPGGTVWNGALDGREFQLTIRPAPGCSDGMSDNSYPMEAVLRVRGETRRGCAAQAADQP